MSTGLTYCSWKELRKLTLIHYGHRRYEKKRKFRHVTKWRFKPYGGLWTSPVNSEWGWKDWCKDENFRECHEDNSFKVKLKKWARVIRVDSAADLEKVPFSALHGGMILIPDYEWILERCDAFWLTAKGEQETRWGLAKNLYGWDCETVLIFNPDCCYRIKD